jgi:hypothetical protein
VINISNKGGDIAATNYFDSPNANVGHLYLSWNASVARVLIPDAAVALLDEMRTGHVCVISRGLWQGKDALELMFDDNSDAPFAVHLTSGMVDRMVSNDGKSFRVAAWTRSGKAFEWEGKYREVKLLPYMEPWTGK